MSGRVYLGVMVTSVIVYLGWLTFLTSNSLTDIKQKTDVNISFWFYVGKARFTSVPRYWSQGKN